MTRSLLRQVLVLGVEVLLLVLQAEHLLDRGDVLARLDEGLLLVDLLRRRLHRGDARADVVVRPDDGRDADLLEAGDGRGRVVGRDDDDGALGLVPCGHEGLDVARVRLLAVHQQRVGARGRVGVGALERLLQRPPGDEALDARHDAEVLVGLRVLHRRDLVGELHDVGERLRAALVEQRVRLGEQLVLNARAGDADLLELADEHARVVEVAVAGVGVDEHRDGRGVRHELPHLGALRPARLVVVADAELGGEGEAGAPDGLEAGLLDDLGGDAVVGLHQELELVRLEHAAQGLGLARQPAAVTRNAGHFQ
mmetsp:Transcript_13780/g.42898  ORF Transcript_13780/g.42898 Transcript_13780/m.42898 type:complete len:311 (-) Transcript_13780:14-946(-)